MLIRDLKVIGTVVGVLDNAYVDVLPESYLPAKMFQNAQCLPRTTLLARELLQERCQSKAKVAINYFTGSSLMESIKEDCSLTSRRCHFGLFSASNDEWLLVPCTTTGPVMRDTVYGDKFKISKQVRSQVPPEENERLGETSPPTHFPHWPNKNH